MRTVRVLLAAFVVGCTTGTGVEDGVEVGTSADTYFVGAPIVVRLVNHTDRGEGSMALPHELLASRPPLQRSS